MAKGFHTGGRRPLSTTSTGRAPLRAIKFPAELNQDLDAMVRATGKTVSEIVRRAVTKEVAAWKRRRGSPPARRGGTP